MPGDPRIRASDADRDRATALLREHHAAGRLTAEEFTPDGRFALGAKMLGRSMTRWPPAGHRPVRLPQHDAAARGLPPVDAPRDPGGAASPVRFSPGTLAVGAWAVVTGTLIAIWAVAAVVGVGTWLPWWLLVAIPWIWVMIRRARRRGE